MISDDLKHDGYAVNAFIEKELGDLREKKIPIKCIVMFSDNCVTQYKSCKVFDMLSKMKIPVIMNHFCTKHGKVEADAAISHLSKHIDNVIHSGQYKIGDSLEMVQYCQLKLQLQPDFEMKICCHYRRVYFHISDINHEGDTDPQTQTVKETLCCLSSVHNTGIPGTIEVCESSSYCEPCFLSMPGECKNWRLVNNFAWASVYKKPNLSGHVENKLWNGFSLPYKPIRTMLKKKVPFKRVERTKNTTKCEKQELDSNITDGKIVSTKEKSLMCVLLESADIPENESSDSDYEDNIPLSDYIKIMKNISE